MSTDAALKLAYDANLDLAKIAPTADPPVCKILDYGKYVYERAKKDKEAKKNQRVIDTKEVRLSVNIDTNDFNTKVKAAQKFLKAGDKVKVSVRFRGREMAHMENGREMLDRFAEACQEYGVVEKATKQEGRNVFLFMAAKPAK